MEIVFRAVYDTSNDIAASAAVVQKRSVIHHIAERVSRPADTAPLFPATGGLIEIEMLMMTTLSLSLSNTYACSGRSWRGS